MGAVWAYVGPVVVAVFVLAGHLTEYSRCNRRIDYKNLGMLALLLSATAILQTKPRRVVHLLANASVFPLPALHLSLSRETSPPKT
jgi:hypothetical protein